MIRSQQPASPTPRRGGRLLCSDRGAAAIELAIVLPVLLLVIFMMVDLGRLLNAQMTLNVAAREAARASVFGQTPTTRARQVTGDTTATATVTAACTSTSTVASTASVTVTDSFTYITPVAWLVTFFKSSTGSITSLTAIGMMPCIG